MPTIAEYDILAAQWLAEVVQPRGHRTTKRVIAEAWHEERRRLTPVPDQLVQRLAGDGAPHSVLHVVDDGQRELGAHVDVRPLTEYEVAM